MPLSSAEETSISGIVLEIVLAVLDRMCYIFNDKKVMFVNHIITLFFGKDC